MGRKNMDRWLGDGGMPIIALVGGAFTAYGVDGEDLGWAAGTFTPEELACNPHGVTQAGVHSLLLDAQHELRHQRGPVGSRSHTGHVGDEDRDDATGRARHSVRPARRGGAHGEAGRLRGGNDA